MNLDRRAWQNAILLSSYMSGSRAAAPRTILKVRMRTTWSNAFVATQGYAPSVSRPTTAGKILEEGEDESEVISPMEHVTGSAVATKTNLPQGKEPGDSGRVMDGDLSKLPSALCEAAPAAADAGEGGEGEDKGRQERQRGGVWHEVGRTEWMRGINHPVFEKKVEVPFFPSAVQVF